MAADAGQQSVFSTQQNRASDFRCEVSKDGPWHSYVLLRAEAWASHTLKADEKKCGIRSVITKTETRGPYTRPFTVYFVHTKTAFTVKGVCKRFSDFKELDGKIRRYFKSFNASFPPDQVLSLASSPAQNPLAFLSPALRSLHRNCRQARWLSS